MSPVEIINQVALYFYLKPRELILYRRTKTVAYARNIAMSLVRKHCDLSYSELGDLFGKRDHSTVISNIKQFRIRKFTDSKYEYDYTKIERKLEEECQSNQMLG